MLPQIKINYGDVGAAEAVNSLPRWKIISVRKGVTVVIPVSLITEVDYWGLGMKRIQLQVAQRNASYCIKWCDRSMCIRG